NGQIDYMLGKLYNDRTQKGLLMRIVTGNVDLLNQQRHAMRLVDQIRYGASDLFSSILEIRQGMASKNGRFRSPLNVRNDVSPALKELASRIVQIGEQITSDEERIEFTSAAERCLGLAGSLNSWLNQSMEEAVYWLEASGQNQQRIKLVSAPVDVGPVLR